MPHEGWYNLGRDPVRIEAATPQEDKIRYPKMYDVGVKEFPPLKNMKLGDVGEAMIRFKISGGGIEIHEMKSVGMTDDKLKDKDKEKLLRRHKKDDFAQSMSSAETVGEY